MNFAFKRFRIPAACQLVLALFCWALTVRAEPSNTIRGQDYLFKMWGTNEGLPVNSITDIAQTPEGYIWAGTLLSGLLRFDGERFVAYHYRNTPEFPLIGLQRLLVDRTGRLWISSFGRLVIWTPEGFNIVGENVGRLASLLYSAADSVVFSLEDGRLLQGRLAGGRWQWKHYPVFEESTAPARICGDARGRIWYLRSPEQLAVWEDGVWRTLEPVPGLGKQKILSLASDRDGDVWVGTDRALMKWTADRFVDMTPADAGPAVPMIRIVPTAGGLWVESPGRLRRFEGGKWIRESKDWPVRYSEKAFRFRRGDNSGGLWMANDELGLIHVLQDGSRKLITANNGLPSNAIRDIYPDREGNIWIGFLRGGLMQLRQRLFRVIGRSEGLSETLVNSVCVDAEGTVWIGTAGRTVSQFKAGVCTNFSLPVPENANDAVVTVDAMNRVWAGCKGGGLLRFTDGQFRTVIGPEKLPGPVRLLQPSRDGRLWVGTLDSIWIVEGDNIREVYVPKDFSGRPSGLAESADGTIWAGTFDGMLLRWNGEKFVSIEPPDHGALGRLWAFCPAPDGSLWMGTYAGGLLRWRDGKFLRLTTANGLRSDFVVEVQRDETGGLWLVTGAGVERIHARDLKRFEQGEISTVPVSRYGRADGLNDIGGSVEFQPNSWRGGDGRLWFAMGNSVASVRPSGVRPNRSPPVVVIEELLANQVRVWPKINARIEAVSPLNSKSRVPQAIPSVTIAPGQHDLEFYFTGLNFRAPRLQRFKYRLEGHDDQWHDGGDTRTARYHSPPPGSYVFHVKAANSDDRWTDVGARLGVVILPFFYETVWFRSAVALVVVTVPAVLVWFSVRRRMRRRLEVVAHQREMERDRARIAKDMHDEIGSKLTRISYLSELAMQNDTMDGALGPQIGTIAETSRDLLKSLDEIVWAVNPRNDTLEHLVAYLGQYAIDYFLNTRVECSLELPSQPPHHVLSSETRHNLFLAFEECLTNVLKHAKARHVRIEMRLATSGFEISVEDDGQGLVSARAGKPEADAGADGLRNIRQRLADIGGGCEVDSKPGSGTMVRLRVPLKPSGK